MDRFAEIARVCHEVNRAACEAAGDTSQVAWEDAPDWERESAIKGVHEVLNDPSITPEQLQAKWRESKLADGWKYGKVKDAEKKTHPCLKPYAKLPFEQRIKDALFIAVVRALDSRVIHRP